MRLAAAFAAHEARTQVRSLRFRVMAAGYVLAASAPAAVCFARRHGEDFVGGATFLLETAAFLPLLTAVFSALACLDGIHRERSEGVWSTIALTEVTSAGYLLRRWLALLAILLPLTVLPLLAAAGLARLAGLPVSPAAALGVWLLSAAPVAVAFSALALGAGTIGGGPVNAFLLLGAVLGLLPSLGNALLKSFGIRLPGVSSWMDLDLASWGVFRLTQSDRDGLALFFPHPATEAGFDIRVLGEQVLVPRALALATGAAALGLAVLYLRRTRPDVQVWRIPPKHPLRTFLQALSRLREGAVPDPSPAPLDLLGFGAGALVAGLLLALCLGRAVAYGDQARERYAVETAEAPAPTAAGVVPGRWRIAGRLAADGEVDLSVAAELHNRGTAPASHLAFELNPDLLLKSAAADRGRVSLERFRERLSVDLDPPIPPGGRRELRFRLSGRPARTVFHLRDRPGRYDFRKSYALHSRARFSRELSDLSRSYRVPAVSALRVDLDAAALTPVPRYRPWSLLKEGAVQEETLHPPADIELSLAADPRLFLATSCGDTSDGAGRLASRCRVAVSEVSVAGGRYRLLGSPAGAAVAVFPSHVGQGEMHLGFLARSLGMLDRAWPGLSGAGRMVFLEWPEEDAHDRHAGQLAFSRRWSGDAQRLEVRDRLVLLGEGNLISSRRLPPESLVARVVTSRLARRRSLAPKDDSLFRSLFQQLAFRRLGIARNASATVGPLRPDLAAVMRIPPPDTRFHIYWEVRFPALVAALEHRVGEETLRLAIDELLAAEGDRPAAIEDLYALLESRSEAPVQRLIQDLFREGLFPQPVLEGVELRRTGDVWRATGRVRNQGDGEALCKVAMTTELAPAETLVRVDTGETASFVLESPYRPQAVFLDPDRECHRLIAWGAPRDRVWFEGGS